MNEHKKFEAKCTYDLLELRGANGEFTTKGKARTFYYRRLLSYYKNIVVEQSLFTERNDYKLLYHAKCSNYKRLLEENEKLRKITSTK